MYKLLVVDDEDKIRALIRKYAEFEGHSVTEAENGMEAVELCRAEKFDLIIMDIMMPELDGFSACREIRKHLDTPILMLSARGEEYDKINGFGLGIDDYVVKPFSPKELMLRVDAIMKRARPLSADANSAAVNPAAQNLSTPAPAEKREIFTAEGLHVDFTGRYVDIDGVRAELSPKEYDLLFYMIRNRSIALTRERLITEVWGYDFFGDDRTLDTHIKLLRKSLGPYSKFITTLRGVGYRFDCP